MVLYDMSAYIISICVAETNLREGNYIKQTNIYFFNLLYKCQQQSKAEVTSTDCGLLISVNRLLGKVKTTQAMDCSFKFIFNHGHIKRNVFIQQ